MFSFHSPFIGIFFFIAPTERVCREILMDGCGDKSEPISMRCKSKTEINKYPMNYCPRSSKATAESTWKMIRISFEWGTLLQGILLFRTHEILNKFVINYHTQRLQASMISLLNTQHTPRSISQQNRESLINFRLLSHVPPWVNRSRHFEAIITTWKQSAFWKFPTLLTSDSSSQQSFAETEC